MLGLVSQSLGNRIRKGPHSAIPVHLALTPSEVSRPAGAAPGMLIFYHHPVTHLKSWWNFNLDPAPTPGSKTGLHFFGSYGLVAIYPGKPSLRILQFFFSNQSTSQDPSFQ